MGGSDAILLHQGIMQCARIIRTTSDQALAARFPDVVDLVGDPVGRGGASGG